MPRFERIGADWHLAAGRALEILKEILSASHEIHARVLERRLQHLWIGRDEVGRGDHVEHLTRGEGHHALVLPGDAAHAGHRVVPPLLIQQERLVDQAERKLLPAGMVEAVVLRQRNDARRSLRVPGAASRVVAEAQYLLHRLFDETRSFAWQEGQVRGPVEIGIGKGDRRQAGGKARGRRMHRAIDDIRECRGGIGIARQRFIV